MPDSHSRSVYRRREGEGYSRQNNALTRILGGPPHVVPTGDALDGGGIGSNLNIRGGVQGET
jgi:hypothetical protein